MANSRLLQFFFLIGLWFIFSLLLPQTLFAHTTHVHSNGFVAGIGHPVLGLDHLLAMVAVGIVSARMGARALWMVPLIFVICILIGALIGGYFADIPYIEQGIVISVITLGLFIALGKKTIPLSAMFFTGLFGLLHGYAHGTEMPAMAEPFLYAAGFVTGTTGLHLTGVLIALGADKIPRGSIILRICGAIMSVIGVWFFTNLT